MQEVTRDRKDPQFVALNVPTVLVVDDYRDSLDMRAVMIRLDGLQVLTADSGETALEVLRQQNIDLVISDVVMPGMGGVELCRRIRSQPATHEIPVLLVTALRYDDEGVREGLLAGADDYLESDAPAELLRIKVARLIAQRLDRRSRMQAEQDLRESEDRYRDLVEQSRDLICTHDLEGRILSANRGAAHLLGYEPAELLRMSLDDVLAPEVRGEFKEYLRRIKRHHKASGRMLVVTKDGRRRIWEYHNTLRTGGLPSPVVRGMAHDITDLVHAQDELETKGSLLQAIIEGVPAGVFVKNREGRYLMINRAGAAWLGRTPDEVIGNDDYSLFSPEVASAISEYDRVVMSSGSIQSYKQHEAIGAETRTFLTTKAPFRNAKGEIKGVLGIALDVTEREQAEQARAHLAAIVESSNDGIIGKTLDGVITSWNEGAERIYGYPAEEMIGRSVCELAPADRSREMRQILERVRGGERVDQFETVRMAKGGRLVDVSLTVSPVKDNSGNIASASTIVRDITERKRLEQQLLQAQKMEAVGQLAGGVAHDFNNLLTAILGYSEMALLHLHEDDPLREQIQEVERAGHRAAALTRQLLAFSRKQVIEPRIINLNDIVREMDKMLRRLIGEDIDLVTFLEPDAWQVRADPNQIEQIILNLAVNARDAMAKGGKLTVETANVSLDRYYTSLHLEVMAGDYVMLAVSDTGVGMDGQTLSKIFEPFFTTKGQGKGTGLGLSSVHGIVKQSGGHVVAYSEPGYGTTFKVYLPRTGRAATQPQVREAEEIPGGSEVVLLVEDDEMVRTLAGLVLGSKGYNVLEASGPREALRLMNECSEAVHLMITDVVMPGTNGRELAERLTGMRPEMKVLYMSGYTEDAIIRHGVLGSSMAFLQKPFSPEALLRKVRVVIDK